MDIYDNLYKYLNNLKWIIIAVLLVISIYYIITFLGSNLFNQYIYIFWIFIILFYIYFLGTKKQTWREILSIQKNN